MRRTSRWQSREVLGTGQESGFRCGIALADPKLATLLFGGCPPPGTPSGRGAGARALRCNQWGLHHESVCADIRLEQLGELVLRFAARRSRGPATSAPAWIA